MKSAWTEVGEHLIHALVFERDAPANVTPILLVHGLGVSSRYMIPTARLLAKHAPVYALDLPGFGKSSKPSRPLDVNELADALAGWMKASGVSIAHIVANSFGCQVVADLALRYRERVKRVVLTAPAVDSSARHWGRQILRLLYDALHEPFSLVFIATADYFAAGFINAWRTLQLALRDRIEDKLPHINAPILFVRGELDPLAPQSWVEELTRVTPSARLVVIPNAAHAVNYNSPEELTKIVLDFIQNG